MKANYKFLFFLIFWAFVGISPSRAQLWEVSLLTADPGKELYSSFGHSAIRLRELVPEGRDVVFNFGTFDFDTPNFYGKFATGKLNYMLSISNYDRFVVEYDYYKRGLREQVLNLTDEQTDFLVQHLDAQYDPARRFYKYDFFYNNCATKIRDAFEIAIGDQLVWNDSTVEEKKTFRNLLDEFVMPLPWADFGIDLALGSVIDRPASPREKQFLPTYMEQAFAEATVLQNGVNRPFVKRSQVILEYPEEPSSFSLFNPLVAFWSLTLIFVGLTGYGFKKGKLMKGLDLLLFGSLGILGLVVTFLWFFTDHTATVWNWNLLWAFPGHLVLVWGLFYRPNATWLSSYLLFAIGATVMVLLLWMLGMQSFSPALIPILLLILLRANFLFYNRKIA
uniref:lipoprotein N-acyltransferase Lnb domain-containing protein n=1 Tax=Algoriphagus sp. TaxID=1872435 RepID=UPI00404774A8